MPGKLNGMRAFKVPLSLCTAWLADAEAGICAQCRRNHKIDNNCLDFA